MASAPHHSELTEMISASRNGAPGATDRLMEAVYDELRLIAHAHRANHAVGDTLTATSLVHEAFLKLVDGQQLPYDGRAHFFGAAARAMRQVIIDAARAKNRDKRGGGVAAVRLDDAATLASPERSGEMLALEEALVRFEAVDPRGARVVECRYFAGLSVDETAAALDLSATTVKRDWAAARAWLHAALAER